MRARAYLIAAFVALVVVALFIPASGIERSPSSFGSAGRGQRALHDLLQELDLCAGRSLTSTARLPERATVWWVEPSGVCDARIALDGLVDILDTEAVSWPARNWIESGGTAVIFLGDAELGRVRCDAIAGFELSERTAGSDGLDAAEAGTPPTGAEVAVVTGVLTASPRRLAGEGILAFEDALDWSVAASVAMPSAVGESGGPFVLERELGAGRIAVVADSRFTHNQWLDSEDAAPLAVDLVRHYGIPFFDEREHGFVSESNSARYLAGSPAWPVFAGLALLGALFAWWGTALPARSVEEFDPEAPTLATFVDSMASLYARSRDYSRLSERYRELTAARLRRHFGLSPEVSVSALAERIERDRRTSPGALRSLTDPRPVTSSRELAAAARDLDALTREVTR